MVIDCCVFYRELLCSSGAEEVAMSYIHLNCQVEVSKKRKVCEMFFSLRDLRAKVVVTHPLMGIEPQKHDMSLDSKKAIRLLTSKLPVNTVSNEPI